MFWKLPAPENFVKIASFFRKVADLSIQLYEEKHAIVGVSCET